MTKGADWENAARARVLSRLGLERLVRHDHMDIEEAHRAHALALAEPRSFEVEGLKIETPAGVYQPHSDSSSRLYIRNILALPPRPLRKVWDVGCGSGVIALFLAARFGSDALATDLSPHAIAATNANARTNHLPVRTRVTDMFANAKERDFDLIVFNSPLIDALPGSGWDEFTMCDPGGKILATFAGNVDQYLLPNGIALTGICCNSAYERLDDISAEMWIVGIEMSGNGFWRAILGLRNGKPKAQIGPTCAV